MFCHCYYAWCDILLRLGEILLRLVVVVEFRRICCKLLSSLYLRTTRQYKFDVIKLLFDMHTALESLSTNAKTKNVNELHVINEYLYESFECNCLCEYGFKICVFASYYP